MVFLFPATFPHANKYVSISADCAGAEGGGACTHARGSIAGTRGLRARHCIVCHYSILATCVSRRATCNVCHIASCKNSARFSLSLYLLFFPLLRTPIFNFIISMLFTNYINSYKFTILLLKYFTKFF